MTENQVKTAPQTGSRPLPLAPFFACALALGVVSSIAVYCSLRLDTGGAAYGESHEQGEGPTDYRKWETPKVAIVFSGEMQGYIGPCGCSEPQQGGLVRRYNFIHSLQTKKDPWTVVGIDLGDLVGLQGIHNQNKLKYVLSMRALSAMNYRVAGIGSSEILSGIGEALVDYDNAREPKKPYATPLIMPLAETEPKQKYYELNVRPYEIISNTTPKIGVINLIGPELRTKLSAREKFLHNMDELPKALNAFAEAGVEIGVILSHETSTEALKLEKGTKQRMDMMTEARSKQAHDCAKFCADLRAKNPKIPPIQLMMVLSEDPEPPSYMRQLDPKLPTQVIEIGHKGKYVGLVGVFGQKGAYQVKYQMVLMSPEWKVKEGTEAKNPIIALEEEYTKDLQRDNFLSKYPRTQTFTQLPGANMKGIKATYVGSDRCYDCHADAFDTWSKWEDKDKKVKGHRAATETLEKLKFPSGRQYDPECMKCHTTGFQHVGGYNDLVTDLANWPKKGQVDAKKLQKHNENLRGVGCESCHGPASEHVKNPKNADMYALINPYRLSPKERMLEEKVIARTILPNEKTEYDGLFNKRMRSMGPNLCMKCHDSENDVHWGHPGQDTADKWIGQKLVHRKPNPNAPQPKNGGAPGVIELRPPPVVEINPGKKD